MQGVPYSLWKVCLKAVTCTKVGHRLNVHLKKDGQRIANKQDWTVLDTCVGCFLSLKQIATTTLVPRYFKRRCLSRDLFTPITSFGFRSPTQMRAWQYGGSDACCFEFQTGQKCWTGWSIPPARAFSRGFCWIFSRREIYCSVDVYESKFGASTRR